MDTTEIKIDSVEDIPLRESVITQSLYKTWHGCKRKAAFISKLGIGPKGGQRKTAARTGQLLHKLLEEGPEYVAVLKAEIQATQDEMMALVVAGEDLTGDLAKRAAEAMQLFDKAHAMARMFWARYPVNSSVEVLGKEIRIIKDVSNDFPTGSDKPVWVGGILDSVVKDQRGDLWIRDIKSHSFDLDVGFAGCEWGMQTRLYRYLAYLEYGVVPKGFIFDRIRVPSIKFCKKDKDFNAYLARIDAWYQDQGIVNAMSSKGVVMGEEVFNDEFQVEMYHIADWSVTHPTVRRVLYESPKTLNEGDCKPFQNVCPFYELCRRDTRDWPAVLYNGYEYKEPRYDIPEEGINEDGTI